ncbi:serine/threonine-protein kinase CTR1-like [Copidosoma floridanum]|uniref:serine/threonine-protein kinase CTR1-like n=1 Tax=Copidosoma floridanum TaxID=29053 RepID=UPI0006C954EE|nr:serine/threonine-protein kinase CTR1-like [Copidosoma floridanum]
MLRGQTDKVTMREITLLSQIRHPNIVSIMALGESDQQLQIIMEYFASFCLYSILFDKTISEQFTLDQDNMKSIAHQNSMALTYLHLHSPQIIHRDVKPSNVLVNRNFLVKLCDLGLGKCEMLQNSLVSTIKGGMCGTHMYMAPEIFLQRKGATAACDVSSFG